MLRLATVVMMLLLLAGCGGQTHRLQGAFILNDVGVEHDGSSCSGTGSFADIRAGLGVVVRDDAGAPIAATTLEYDPHSSTSQCVYRWQVTVGEAQAYSIEVGERLAGTYSVDDLNGRYWQVATTIGE